ncbi:MAG: hypothetical protein AB1805_15320 [Nitrospirota bacterium]
MQSQKDTSMLSFMTASPPGILFRRLSGR